MSLRNTLRKAAGLLVELPPDETEEAEETTETHETKASPQSAGGATDKLWADLEKAAQKPVPNIIPPPTKTVEQIARDEHGPNLDQIRVTAATLPANVSGEGAVDFGAIYHAASLPTAPFTAEQVLDMVTSLPAEVPLETRRQMIRVSVNAMGKAIGTTPESIVADASRKLAALTAYTEHLTQTTTEYTSLSEQKVASLQAEIEKIRQAVASAQQRQARETQQCIAEANRLDDVLEFFSLDVSPSKYSPLGPETSQNNL